MSAIKQAVKSIIDNMSPAERALVVSGDRSVTRWILRNYTPANIATVYEDIPSNEIDAICWHVEVSLAAHIAS